MVRGKDSHQDAGFQIEICFEHRSISRQRYRLNLGSEDEWDHIDPRSQQVGIVMMPSQQQLLLGSLLCCLRNVPLPL